MGDWYMNVKGYSETLDCLIVAICRDFCTRSRALSEKMYKRRTLMEYEYLNRRLIDATSEIVGTDYEIYINEIGNRIGYAYSQIDGISETEYKTRKKQVKVNIAKKLHLMD